MARMRVFLGRSPYPLLDDDDSASALYGQDPVGTQTWAISGGGVLTGIPILGQIGTGAPNLQSIDTAGTITPTAGTQNSIIRVATSTAANKTAVLMAAGTLNQQIVVVINESANTITFATVATSNVQDGANVIIPANRARQFIWDNALATPAWVAFGAA